MNNKSKFLIAIGALALLGAESSYAMRRTEESGGKKTVSRVRKVAVQPVADPSAAAQAGDEAPRGRKRVTSKALPEKKQEETAIMSERIALAESLQGAVRFLEQAVKNRDCFSSCSIIFGVCMMIGSSLENILAWNAGASHDERLEAIGKAENLLRFYEKFTEIFCRIKPNELIAYLSNDTNNLLGVFWEKGYTNPEVQAKKILSQIKLGIIEELFEKVEVAKIRDSLFSIADPILKSKGKPKGNAEERFVRQLNQWCDDVLSRDYSLIDSAWIGGGVIPQDLRSFIELDIPSVREAVETIREKLNVEFYLFCLPYRVLKKLKERQADGVLDPALIEESVEELNHWCDYDVLSPYSYAGAGVRRRIKEDSEGVKRVLEPFLKLEIPEISAAVKNIYKKIKAIQVEE